MNAIGAKLNDGGEHGLGKQLNAACDRLNSDGETGSMIWKAGQIAKRGA